MASAPSAVLLDLGNVLLFHDNAHLFRALAARAGKPEAALELAHVVSADPSWNAANRGELDAEGVRERVCRLLGADIPMPEFQFLWSSHFSVHEAVMPYVGRLLGRVKVILVSNTNVLHVEHFLPRLPILARFDGLILSCEVGAVKPEPQIYELALKKAGVSAEDAVFFDDVPEYVDAAKRLGMRGFVFTTATQFARHLLSLGLS